MRPKTKAQANREIAYRTQLRRCGFRSWKQANKRRCELIEQMIESGNECDELKQLQRLADLYLTWKTNDSAGRWSRRIRRLEKRLGFDLRSTSHESDSGK